MKSKTSAIYWLIGIGGPGLYFILKIIELLGRIPGPDAIIF